MKTERESKQMANFGKGRTVGLWILRGLLAATFFAAGGAKLAGAQVMVAVFAKIGIGQWFRIVTGVLEVSGGILLLIPRVAFYGAALLLPVMVGAVAAHLTVVGGSPAGPLLLLILNAVTAWLMRDTWKKDIGPSVAPVFRLFTHLIREMRERRSHAKSANRREF